MRHILKKLTKLSLRRYLTKGEIRMKVIEVAHPIQEDQYITEDVAMAFGFLMACIRGTRKYLIF